MSDFDDPSIADSDNAAWYLRQAFASLTSAADPIGNIDLDALWRKRDISQLGPIYDGNQQAINFLRQAGQHGKAVWFASSANSASPSELNQFRWLALVTQGLVTVPHVRGQDAEAMRMMHDELRMADAVEHYFPGITNQLTASGIRYCGIDNAINLSRDLLVSEGSSSAAASRQQVLDAISQLLDERENQNGFIRGIQGDRVWREDVTANALPGEAVDPESWPLLPLLDVNAAVSIREESGMLAIIPADPSKMCWPALGGTAGNAELISGAPRTLVGQIAAIRRLAPHLMTKLSEIQCFDLFNSRAAAMALAIRLYRFDHGGKWPESLSQLIPQYLPRIPVDPFSPTVASILYKLNQSTDPIIYSVGENGMDDAGSDSLPSGVRFPGRFNQLDIVVHLINQSPATQPEN